MIILIVMERNKNLSINNEVKALKINFLLLTLLYSRFIFLYLYLIIIWRNNTYLIRLICPPFVWPGT